LNDLDKDDAYCGVELVAPGKFNDPLERFRLSEVGL